MIILLSLNSFASVACEKNLYPQFQQTYLIISQLLSFAIKKKDPNLNKKNDPRDSLATKSAIWSSATVTWSEVMKRWDLKTRRHSVEIFPWLNFPPLQTVSRRRIRHGTVSTRWPRNEPLCFALRRTLCSNVCFPERAPPLHRSISQAANNAAPVLVVLMILTIPGSFLLTALPYVPLPPASDWLYFSYSWFIDSPHTNKFCEISGLPVSL